jgi:hypothetical protein
MIHSENMDKDSTVYYLVEGTLVRDFHLFVKQGFANTLQTYLV